MKRKFKVIAILALGINLSSAYAAELELKTESQQFSYALGYGIASQYQQRLKQTPEVKLDTKAFIQAVEDVFGNGKKKLSAEKMREVMQAVGGRLQVAANKQKQAVDKSRTEAGKKNKETGEKFLAENQKKSGVKVTQSGMQYEVLKSGAGTKTPSQTDTVVVNYKGTLINGTEFDSSYKRNKPATFSLNGIIKGWQEALQMMKVGDKWKIVLPSEVAYGARGAGATIGPNATLIFEVELLEIK